MIHTGKEVVLDLKVEPPGAPERQGGVWRYGVRGASLVPIPVNGGGAAAASRFSFLQSNQASLKVRQYNNTRY